MEFNELPAELLQNITTLIIIYLVLMVLGYMFVNYKLLPEGQHNRMENLTTPDLPVHGDELQSYHQHEQLKLDSTNIQTAPDLPLHDDELQCLHQPEQLNLEIRNANTQITPDLPVHDDELQGYHQQEQLMLGSTNIQDTTDAIYSRDSSSQRPTVNQDEGEFNALLHNQSELPMEQTTPDLPVNDDESQDYHQEEQLMLDSMNIQTAQDSPVHDDDMQYSHQPEQLNLQILTTNTQTTPDLPVRDDESQDYNQHEQLMLESTNIQGTADAIYSGQQRTVNHDKHEFTGEIPIQQTRRVQMTETDISKVAEKLAGTTVEGDDTLSFVGRGMKLDKEEDAKEIVEQINNCGRLRALRFEGNTMGVEAAKVIGESLEKHPEFERALWSDMFTGRLKTEIPTALKHLANGMMTAGAKLVELDLSDNAFGPNGMIGLQDFLKSESCYALKELRLNNNGLGVTGGKMLADCLLECHKKSSAAGTPLALRVFISGRGRLEDEGSTALAKAFEAMGSLEEVQMPQNGINAPGISALASAFSKNKNLRIISLNDNTFTEEGAKEMAKALPHLQNLEVINFGDCILRTEGAKFLADALHKGHVSLKELNLSFNEIHMSGANQVAEAMENKEALEKIDLNGNQLGDEGIELVQGTLEAIGKEDCLGSLSDDEGDEEEGEEEPQDESEGEEICDSELQVRGNSISPTASPRPAEKHAVELFLQLPIAAKLLQLGPDRAQLFLARMGDEIENIDKVVAMVCKISSVVKLDDRKVQEAAYSCADVLLSELNRALKEDDRFGSLLANSFLVHIGILKSEDKIKPVGDTNGTLIVLEHIVQQEYFPSPAREILQIFLSRPHKCLDLCKDSKHLLLQTLYHF